MAYVSSLHIYPIKSCAGIQVTDLDVDVTGIGGDREWVIVDQAQKFLTQRTHPRMALIKTALKNGQLELQFGGDQFLVPAIDGSRAYEPVQVWSSAVQALRSQNENLQWALSDFLSTQVSLFQFGIKSEREVKKSGQALGAQVKFADQTSFLITSQESLKDLNERLQEPVSMDRFRPNVVIAEMPAWQEDGLRNFKLGTVDLEFVQNCGRCGIVNVDHLTGEVRSKEVLQTLSQFRKTGNSIDFGIRAVHRSAGKISVGDRLLIQ